MLGVGFGVVLMLFLGFRFVVLDCFVCGDFGFVLIWV